MYRCEINVESEWGSMCHWTVLFIKINTFNLRNPICTVACNKFISIRTVTFLNTISNEWTGEFCSFREGFDWDGSWKKANIPVFFILKKITSFHNCLWVQLKPSPILFGVRGFFGRLTSRCETTGMTWSNLERISSRSVLWYLLLLHRLIFILDLPRGVWRLLS